jgi:hypothetical protein
VPGRIVFVVVRRNDFFPEANVVAHVVFVGTVFEVGAQFFLLRIELRPVMVWLE